MIYLLVTGFLSPYVENFINCLKTSAKKYAVILVVAETNSLKMFSKNLWNAEVATIFVS